ncbi:tRNA lysidine(34) synthetase TilS [Streptococcus dentiloxodontae]
MTENLLKRITNQGYFLKHSNILIAVSGGADSMSLLHFFYTYKEHLNVNIAIAHVNHKQRPESDEEEKYLSSWAQEHNVPFYSSSFTGSFSEKSARDFRYNFFKEVMKNNGYTALVTAHHADDQAETVFMKLLRGSRLRHLAGMKIVVPFANGQLIRPFLTLKKSELPQVFHFEDSSNGSRKYLRNRIRLDYLPILENENPQLRQYLIRLGKESHQLLEALSDLTADIELTNLAVFQKQTRSVQIYLLQNYLAGFADLNLGQSQFDDLLIMLQNSKYYKTSLKSGYFLYKDDKKFKISQKKPNLNTELKKCQILLGQNAEFSGYHFTFSHEVSSEKNIVIDADNPLILRHRQAGDKIDFGTHHKKIRRLFIDEKISQEERSKAIIGQQGDAIIFILVRDKLYLKKKPENAILKGVVNIIKLP